jgi:transcriptional regulator with XRE-family HTH domain
MKVGIDVIGKRILLLRVQKGWSQDELADRAGLTPRTIGKIEAGLQNPGFPTYHAIAKALEVDPGYLMGEEFLIRA